MAWRQSKCGGIDESEELYIYIYIYIYREYVGLLPFHIISTVAVMKTILER